MKWLLLCLLLLQAAFSASIDTNLFEGDGKEAYYPQIEAKIEASEKSGLIAKEVTAEEKALLAKLRNAAGQKIAVELYELKDITQQKKVSMETFYKAIDALAGIRLKTDKHHSTLKQLQSKLSFTKQKIENITEEEKPHLLSYQLQFAYYKVQQKTHETKKLLLDKHTIEISNALISTLTNVNCSTLKSLDANLATAGSELERMQKKRIAVEIQREKELLDDSKRVEILQKRWEQANSDYGDAVAQICIAQIHKAVCLLKQKENKPFFALLEEIDESIKSLSKEQRSHFEKQKEILKEIAKETFGSTKLFLGATQQEIAGMWAEVSSFATSPLFVFNEQPVSIVSLAKALVLIIAGFLAGALYKRWVIRMSRRWPDMSQMSIRLAANLGNYLIVFISFMVAIASIGIDMTSISLIAGALSIGIGFGLQTVVSNLIAGVILMFERTIRIGDTIEISDTLRGRVTDMRIRSTTIKTFDNIDIVIPNSSFIQSNVINWTLEDKTRRLHIPFGVAYGTEVQKVKNTVLEELLQSELTYIRDDKEKQPEVWMVAMNSSSVDFELLVWIEWTSKLRPNSLRSDFLILIYDTLYKNGIQIPFPQLDLHIKELPDKKQ